MLVKIAGLNLGMADERENAGDGRNEFIQWSDFRPNKRLLALYDKGKWEKCKQAKKRLGDCNITFLVLDVATWIVQIRFYPFDSSNHYISVLKMPLDKLINSLRQTPV